VVVLLDLVPQPLDLAPDVRLQREPFDAWSSSLTLDVIW
jgi:hypothetical protein